MDIWTVITDYDSKCGGKWIFKQLTTKVYPVPGPPSSEGGQTLKLVEKYLAVTQKKLVYPEKQRLCDGVYAVI